MNKSKYIDTLINELEAQRQLIQAYENNERDFRFLERKIESLKIENDVLKVKIQKLERKYRNALKGSEIYRKFKLYKQACIDNNIIVKE